MSLFFKPVTSKTAREHELTRGCLSQQQQQQQEQETTMRSINKVITIVISFFFLVIHSTNSNTQQPHSTVQDLNESNFDDALVDPANGFWLLKFYAPWCGHCKKLAPLLDKIAVYVKGKMAIGKIDCTKHKSLCSRFDVRSYPTLKFYRDGDFYDYTGQRDADSIIEFAEKMSLSAVSSVTSVSSAYDDVAGGGNSDGVAFIAHDPAADDKLDDIQDILQSTTLFQVFQQVARKRQAYASFAIVDPGMLPEDVDGFGVGHEPFIIKIEKDVAPIVYEDKIETNDLLQFVKSNNVPLVTKLGAHNFRTVGYLGKPLLILVVNPDSDDAAAAAARIALFTDQLKDYAKSGTHKSAYTFCQMDGKKWERFLNQFDIHKVNLPQFFVLDVPQRIFWQNSTASAKSLSAFIDGIQSGDIPSQEQAGGGRGGGGVKGLLYDIKMTFMENMPYSGIMMGVMFTMLYLILALGDAETVTESSTTRKKNE